MNRIWLGNRIREARERRHLTHETQLHSIILYELLDELPVVEQRKLVHMKKAYCELWLPIAKK